MIKMEMCSSSALLSVNKSDVAGSKNSFSNTQLLLVNILATRLYNKPASLLSGHVFVCRSGGLRFKSRPIKLDTVLPRAHHCCDIFSKGAVSPYRNDAKLSPVNLIHASA